MPRCYLALGGNVGSVEQTFERALAQLDALSEVSVGRRSGVHEFPAVGPKTGGTFQNAAVEIDTDLSPFALLGRIQAIEHQLGRTRHEHWRPRTIDLDLILYGSLTIDEPRLRIPHPACWYRRFVLDPLCEIAGDVVHPERQKNFGELRSRLLKRPMVVSICGASRSTRHNLIEKLQPVFSETELREWNPKQPDAQDDPALVVWLGTAEDDAMNKVDFASLPRAARIDLSSHKETPESSVGNILQSALGR